jgi:hypothetical protein
LEKNPSGHIEQFEEAACDEIDPGRQSRQDPWKA